MAPKPPPTRDEQDTAIALMIMAASASTLTVGAEDIYALAHGLWPASIHRNALDYGPAAIAVVCTAFGIDAEQMSILAQHLIDR